jgi:cephalosporin hydroxylase
MLTPNTAAENYHRWYYDSRVWTTTSYTVVPILKWVGDLWNYQEIVYRLQPQLIVEFGSWEGGSALYLSDILNRIRPGGRVLSIDIDPKRIHQTAKDHPAIEWMNATTVEPRVANRIQSLREQLPGPVFFIIDSDHSKQQVLGELESLREITQPGDYVVVEEGNLNGHPVLPGWGAGPFEALEDYFQRYPRDYRRDSNREAKFGFSFAPGGFLIRQETSGPAC